MKSTQSYGDYLKRIIKVQSIGARMEGMEMKQEEDLEDAGEEGAEQPGSCQPP